MQHALPHAAHHNTKYGTSTLPYATTTVAVSQTYSPLQKVEILAPEQLVTIPSGLPQEQGIEVDPAKIKAIIDMHASSQNSERSQRLLLLGQTQLHIQVHHAVNCYL